MAAHSLENTVTQRELWKDIREACWRLQAVEAQFLVEGLASFKNPKLIMRGAVKHCEILSNLLENSLFMLQSTAQSWETIDTCEHDVRKLKDIARQSTAVFEACRASVKACRKVQGQLSLCVEYSIESSDLELIKVLFAKGYWLVRSTPPSVNRVATGKKDGPVDKKAADALGEGRGTERDPLVLVSSPLIMQENDGGETSCTGAADRKAGVARCRALLTSTYGVHTEYEQHSEEGDVIRFGHCVRWYRDRWREVDDLWASSDRVLVLPDLPHLVSSLSGGAGGARSRLSTHAGAGGSQYSSVNRSVTVVSPHGWRLKDVAAQFEKTFNKYVRVVSHQPKAGHANWPLITEALSDFRRLLLLMESASAGIAYNLAQTACLSAPSIKTRAAIDSDAPGPLSPSCPNSLQDPPSLQRSPSTASTTSSIDSVIPAAGNPPPAAAEVRNAVMQVCESLLDLSIDLAKASEGRPSANRWPVARCWALALLVPNCQRQKKTRGESARQAHARLRYFGDVLRNSAANVVSDVEWERFVQFLDEEHKNLEQVQARRSEIKAKCTVLPHEEKSAVDTQCLRTGPQEDAALPESLKDLELKLRDKKRALGWVGKVRESDCQGGLSSRDEEIDEQYKSWTRGHILGTGGFGIVFRAQLWSSLEFVAVKEVNCKSMPEKMEKEIRVMMRLKHPHIVRIHGHLRVEGTTIRHIVMQYCPDGTLRNFINDWKSFRGSSAKQVPVLPQKLVRLYTRQLLQALEYLHSGRPGLIHHDMKAANILLANNGQSVSIADFGEVRASMQSLLCVRW